MRKTKYHVKKKIMPLLLAVAMAGTATRKRYAQCINQRLYLPRGCRHAAQSVERIRRADLLELPITW